ncbi:MAG TPA: heat-inducible transcriptional repressor HrcA [bacterium]|nr:heat-inducible transcriptional repressor HrcA [bacterium]
MKERKANILKHVVTDYVGTCAPVGSKRIAERLGVSPATVRNAMHELSEEGYLEQPHTSAGRVPGDPGYRFFVDYLLDEYRAAEEECRGVQQSLDIIRFKLEQLFEKASELLSEMGDCLSFVAAPGEDMSRIARIELTAVSANGLLIILVMSNGLIENRLVELPTHADRLPLKHLAKTLNERLAGLRLVEVTSGALAAAVRDVRISEELLYGGLKRFFEELIFAFGRKIYFDGTAKLVRHPEFQNVGAMGQVLELIDSAESGSEMFETRDSGDSVSVVIGRENSLGALRECSVVKSCFRFGDQTLGAIGVIGPRRMDYARMIWLVRDMAGALSHALDRYPRL